MNTISQPSTHEQPLTRIEGPACWTGESLRASDDWVHVLASHEIDEIELAAERLAHREPTSIALDEFPLPRLAPRLAAIREEVMNGKGLALFRRVPVTGRDEATAARMLWGIGLHLGVPQPQDAAGALLHHVRDIGASTQGRDDIRTFQTNEAQPWHNDGGDAFMLLCRAQANNGGKSYLASVHSVYNALLERDPALVEALQQEFHFDARGQGLPGRGNVQVSPVMIWHLGRLFILHKRHYIEMAQRFEEVPRLTEVQQAAIDALESICNDPGIHIAFDLEPGDMQFANNFSVLHKRGAFDRGLDRPSERHMLRLWLGMPDGWPLPEAFRQTREFGSLFDVRGASSVG